MKSIINVNRVLIILFLFSCSCYGGGNNKYDFVKDNASILTSSDIRVINKSLNEYYNVLNKQFLVYTVSGTQGVMNTEAYSNELIKRIDFGSVGFENSLVMLIYLQDHFIMFRWGKKFNINMSDSTAQKLVQNAGKYFSKSQYKEGIVSTINIVKKL